MPREAFCKVLILEWCSDQASSYGLNLQTMASYSRKPFHSVHLKDYFMARKDKNRNCEVILMHIASSLVSS
jgi:hypothetical protein